MKKYAPLLLCMAFSFIPVQLYAQAHRSVAIIGTGDMGDSIGPQLAKKGYDVVYGSRTPTSKAVRDLVRRTGPDARATTQRQAARKTDIVVLVVPWPAMEKIAQNLGNLEGKIVVDVSLPIRQAEDGYLESTVDTSSAQMIQAWNPGARVVKTVLAGSNVIDEPMSLGGRVTSFVAADDIQAKEIVAGMVADLGLSPLDAGPLRNAKAIEAWARLWFVPVLQKRKQGFELAVLPSNHWHCIWQDEWYEPVADSENLAQFPAPEKPPEPCPAE